MGFKAILPIFSFTLFLFLLPLLFQAVLADPKDEHQSPFEFLQHLRGCQKGNKVKDLNKLKKYLEHFGYLSYDDKTHADDDDFDELLEHAIKTYQLNYNLNATGTLNPETVTKMMSPRCAVPDIMNGTSGMNSGKHKHFHTVAHYAFFPGRPKWPASKFRLTYAFRPGTRATAITPVNRAFQTWASKTHFRFRRITDFRRADIKISFERGNHGDGFPFDGPGGTLAHAFAPTNGRFHYDADERWSVSVTPGFYHLETVALHEIGHLLGLHHSSVPGAIMYPTFSTGQRKGLHSDDLRGIKALYRV